MVAAFPPVVVAFALLGFSAVSAEAKRSAAPRADPAEISNLYQAGVDDYARGNVDRALVSFREVLRRDPKNVSALSAVRRLERELPVALRVEPAAQDATPDPFERFVLILVPRWFYFERTLGNRLSDVGALDALNARVTQLIGEKKRALALNVPFGKERQLRALLRRSGAVAQGDLQA